MNKSIVDIICTYVTNHMNELEYQPLMSKSIGHITYFTL